MRRAASAKLNSRRGQSLVELAICAPVLLTLVLGAVDLGRAFYYREQVSNAARQALRVAVQQAQQPAGNTACAGTGTSTATVPASSGNNIYTIANAAALENSSNGTASGSSISGATVKVTWHCTSGNAVTNSTDQGITDPNDSRSDAVEVKVTYQMSLVTPFVSQIVGNGSVTLTDDVKGRAEY